MPIGTLSGSAVSKLEKARQPGPGLAVRLAKMASACRIAACTLALFAALSWNGSAAEAQETTAPTQTQAHADQPPQIIAFYGHPGVPFMGALGQGQLEEVADWVTGWAAYYDYLNGARGAVPAFHLITGVAQRSPTGDGTYLYRLSFERVSEYVEIARRRGLLLFLDVQIGWSSPLAEVRLLEPFLLEPFVHVAIDPEFATGPLGVRPGYALGYVTGTQVNEVQQYLANLVAREGLPPKILVVHQFAKRMLRERETLIDYEAVQLSIDMDGFGSAAAKVRGYELYANAPPSERPGFKLFFRYDTPMMTPEQVMALVPPPDLVIYQ